MNKRNFAFISSDLAIGNIEEADSLLMIEIEKRCNLIKINPLDFSVKVHRSKSLLFVGGERIDNIDYALVRRARGLEEDVYSLANLLDKNGVKIFDGPKRLIYPLNKINISMLGFNRPISYYSNSFSSLKGMIDKNMIKFPVIAKPVKGHQGQGVVKINSDKELEIVATDFFSKNKSSFFFQEYIEIAHEYRVFVVGSKALGVVEKRTQDGIIAKNYALGAEFVQVENPEVVKMAEKICKTLKNNFSGVDIIEDKNGKLYLLECNRSPQFVGFREATGIKVEEKIIDYFFI